MKPIPKTLFVELALPEGIEMPPATFLDEFGHWPAANSIKRNNQKHYDELKFDNSSLLCLRLPANYAGKPSLKVIEYHCKVASESQSFYRSISGKQWLRTVITSDKPSNIFFPERHANKAHLEIHSNVVPREAYLNASCRNLHSLLCTRGFLRASQIFGDSKNFIQSCGDCAFLETLQTQFKTGNDLPMVLKFPFLGMEEVELLNALAPASTEDDIYKVLWRKGVFVRKRFKHGEPEEQGDHELGFIQNPNLNTEYIQNSNMNRELDVALSVLHPNVVYYFGCSKWAASESEGYLFMELLMEDLGSFLFEVARDDALAASFSVRDKLCVLLQVAQAMEHLHEKNFVHGDLKPQNVFMSRFELAHSGVQYYLAKVGDFGCAHRVDSSSGAIVGTLSPVIGTFNYTAPEVFRYRGNRALLPKHPQKIDVYSFGVVAFQVLTGVTHLYEDLKKKSIKDGVMNGGLRPDSGFSGRVAADLLPYIRKCWHQEPETRPCFTEICDTLLSIIKRLDHGVRRKNGTDVLLPDILQTTYKRLCRVTILQALLQGARDTTKLYPGQRK